MSKYSHLPLLSLLFFLFSCGGSKTETPKPLPEFSVKVRLNPEPAGLNAITVNDAGKTIVLQYIHFAPIGLDLEKLEWTPMLAKSMPEMETDANGKQLVHVELREEATWDDGKPVTAEDVLFSMKLAKLPTIKQNVIRGFFREVEDILVDPQNPKKYTVVFAQPYMLSPTIAGDMTVLPKHIYDSAGALDKIKLNELHTLGDAFVADSAVIAFSEAFSSEKYNRETIVGCGPYKLESWEAGARITLTRKKDWWGDKVKDGSHFFTANPARIQFEFIKDETAAITSLKAGDLDLMYSIDPLVFTEELPKSEKFTANYNTFTPQLLGYESIGINMRKEPFTDVNVRKALAHLADIDRILNTVYYGLGQKITTYIPASKKEWINNQLVPYDFNPEKAKELLALAGWTDTDGNGILDKQVNGRKKEFKTELLYNAGNPRREKISLLYAEELEKVGIKVEIKVLEIPVLVERLKKHDFELYIGGFLQSVIESDPYQLWHSESGKGGTNFPDFGDAASDSLISAYRSEMDVEKRKGMLKTLQQMIHDQVPVVFLCTGKERIAIKKNLTGTVISDQRPGFWLGTMMPVETTNASAEK